MTRTLCGILAAALLAASPALGTTASPQITDPARDVQVTAAPTVDVPDPSVDLLSVTFGRLGDDLTVAIRALDLDHVQPGAGPVQHKVFSVHFRSDQHHLVLVDASYDAGDGWSASIMCLDAQFAITCYEDLAPPTLDFTADELRMQAPLSAFGGRVLAPSAYAYVQYQNVPDVWPTVALQDYAPNCQVLACEGGADYDPYG